MRRISVFGATGSIGENTLDLMTPGTVEVVALTGGRQVDRLAAHARRFDADLAVTAHPECYGALKDALSGTRTEVAAGPDAVAEAADRPADWVMSAIVGAAGLVPGMRALAHGGTLALANKAIEARLAALGDTEAKLASTIAMADGAAEADLARLTSVYESMKPKDAAALFEQMAPPLAAGFLGRMKPGAAAGILGGMTAQRAYAVTALLAGRNAGAPTQ